MSGGVHPEVVDDDGGRGFAYIFRDEAEVCACIGSTFGQIRFVIELMGDVGMIGHLAGVGGGGFSEYGVKTKRREPLIGAGFVGSGQKILLGYGEIVGRREDALGAERGR